MKQTQIKRIKRPVHGVLLLDKPYGASSNQALQKCKWLLQAEKGGHTGVLDPLATGLLPLCFGDATKFAQRMLDADKRYVCGAISDPAGVLPRPWRWAAFMLRRLAPRWVAAGQGCDAELDQVQR